MKIPKDIQEKIHEFAKNYYTNYRNNTNRDEQTQINYLKIGLCGEYCFWNEFKYLLNTPFEIQLISHNGNDGGFDFQIKNTKFDIKATNYKYAQRLYFNPHYMKADIYIMYKISPYLNNGELLGWITKTKLKSLIEPDKNYIDIKHLTTQFPPFENGELKFQDSSGQ